MADDYSLDAGLQNEERQHTRASLWYNVCR